MKRGFLIAAAIFMTVGLVMIWGALLVSRFEIPAPVFDFHIPALVSDSDDTKTQSSLFNSEFNNLEIEAKGTDITIAPYNGADVKVESSYGKNDRLSTEIKNGTMKIIAARGRRGNGFLSLFSKSFSVKVYLPSKAYKDMTIVTTEGDIRIGKGLTVSSSDITTRTGDVRFAASVDGLLRIKTTTGDIRLDGVKAEKTEIKVTTGDIVIDGLKCAGEVSAAVITGDVRTTDMICGSFDTSGTTGDVRLTDTVAAGSFDIKRTTGDVRFENCDAGEITVRTSTGDVNGTLRTGKSFITHTSIGSVSVPESSDGGKCEITTSIGDIEIRLK